MGLPSQEEKGNDNTYAHKMNRNLNNPMRRLSVSSHLSGFDFDDSQSLLAIDIADNHARKSMTMKGRESHTADLVEFDRYMDLLREYRCSFDCSERSEKITFNDDNHNNNDSNITNISSISSLGETNYNSRSFFSKKFDNDSQKFWSYVRSVLEQATPVGYSEIEDPTAVVPKGPDDVLDFFGKVVGLSVINPIHPNIIAEKSELSLEVVMDELFHATKVGLVEMLWTPECVRCGSAACTVHSLNDIPDEVDCDSCSIHNTVDTLDHIKVVFRLVSSVLYMPADNFACTPSSLSMSHNAIFTPVPATDSGSGFRYSTGCGGKKKLRESLPKGKYRMHCPVAMTDSYLIVEKEATKDDNPVQLNLPVSEMVCHGPATPRKTITVPHGRVHFDVHANTGSFFVLWVQDNQEDEDILFHLPQDERAVYTTAAYVIHHPTFHTLFPNQVVPGSQVWSLSISKVILVFTDIVGSTAMYANLGDGKALELVRRHFKVLFRAFRRGRVVKTIGDAVMAAFPSSRAAMEAVAEALWKIPQHCQKPDGTPLEIRVGIHAGSACVVPLNGISDYFGQTVNVTARIEAAAKASEALVTDAVFKSDPDAQDAYDKIVRRNGSSQFFPMPLVQLNLKGVEGTVLARGFRVKEMAKRSKSIKLPNIKWDATTTFDDDEQPVLASKQGRRVSRSQNHSRIDINDDASRSLSMNDLVQQMLTEQEKKKKKVVLNETYRLRTWRSSLSGGVPYESTNNHNNQNQTWDA